MNSGSTYGLPEECLAATRLFTPFLDGELTEAAETAVSNHVRQCSRCRAGLEDERAANRFFKQSLSGAARAESDDLVRRVRHALLATSSPPLPVVTLARVWMRALAAAALLILGLLVGGAGVLVWQGENVSRPQAPSPELASRVQGLCDLAGEVLPDARYLGAYPEAAADLSHFFPGDKLPHSAVAGSPQPRVFGSTIIGDDRVHWVVYCTGVGAPEFTERFVLVTTSQTCLESAIAGLERLEMDVKDLSVLVWREGPCYRVLITRRDAGWARQQRDALLAG